MSNIDWLRSYWNTRLLGKENDLNRYLGVSSVVSVELDEGIVYDLMVLIPDSLFEEEFKNRFGECYVVNDQTWRFTFSIQCY